MFIRLLIVTMLAAFSLAAQTSSLKGEVTDGQGATIPDAVITLTNRGTAAVRKTTSDAAGAYNVPSMPPGTYKLEAVKPGFRAFVAQVTLQIDTPASLDIRMELGQVTEVVNVEASASSVNVENASVGNPFTELQIKQIPLQTRNVVDLLRLQPGVAPSGQVAGARADQNNVALDGVDVNDNQGQDGFNAVLPVPLDSVQEFRTTVAGMGADAARSSGGQVSLVTKSGSNQFHGTLYEYNRNTFFSANNWFSNRANVAREPLVRNQYGASIGGPVLKDRLFFFFNWESRKDRSGSAQTRVVPTESFKQGIIKVALTNGRTVELSPADVRAIDPMHAGASSYMLEQMKQYPAGNDPAAAADRGLNLSVLRFNAPNTLDNRAYVGKMDFNIDPSGKHTLSVRGTLNASAQDNRDALAQFPGQAAASRTLDNSRGLSIRETAVLSSHIVNVANYGYTRLGSASTGSSAVVFGNTLANLIPTTRPSQRVAPTSNFVDDLTWTKERHQFQAGVNFRFFENNRLAFNNLPNYSYNRNTLLGLGSDITAAVISYLQPTQGTVALSSGTNVTNAFGTLLGVVNQYGATYNFGRDGKAIPFGQPVTRSFKGNSYEFYFQDTFKVRRNLTLTYGVRYMLDGVPYEQNGVQVQPKTPLNQFFADRVGAMPLGIPNSLLPSALISYDLGGPVNKGRGWYDLDKNNFAPRASLAWSPSSGTFEEKIFGKGSVIRGGGAVVYDKYGNNMVVTFSNSGSPGLASTISQPLNTNFTTAVRYGSPSSLPALPAAPSGGFPYTPPVIVGGFTSFSGISTDVKAPYQYVLNASYARPLPKNLSIEIGYVGRLGHQGLVRQDYAQPMTNFKDPVSGQTWTQASGILRQYYDQGLTAAQVRANPALIPAIPFFESMFAKAANRTFAGSATANYFNSVYGTYAGSDLDALNDMDRLKLADGTCISRTGCNTFFAMQAAGVTAFSSAGKNAYNAGTLVFRRAVSNGWGFDLNYTLAHALDNASGSESDNASTLQDAFNPDAFRGPSTFDARHIITANTVVELPFGKGKKMFNAIPMWLDYVVGGWELSALASYRSGLPLNVSNAGIYPTNYLNAAIGVLRSGATLPENSLGFDQTGAPSIFRNTSAVQSFMGQYPGTVGSRGILRGNGQKNIDLAVSKNFRFRERVSAQLRGEAFNAFNFVNFGNPNLSLANPATFGQITSAGDARVMQLALRISF